MDINPNCAYLYSDTPPDEAQLEALLKFLKKRHNIEKLEYFRDENIKGGFKMTAGNRHGAHRRRRHSHRQRA